VTGPGGVWGGLDEADDLHRGPARGTSQWIDVPAAVRELYARLTRVWGRTGHIDLSLIHEARHTATDHRTTIAELGLKFRHYAEQKRLRKEHREHCCWHPHQLRHNYATMIRKRFGVEEASDMLDHSSVKMTEVYAERDQEQALEIARQVG